MNNLSSGTDQVKFVQSIFIDTFFLFSLKRTITLVCGIFFAGPLFITKVWQRDMSQYYFCTRARPYRASEWIRAQVATPATSTGASDSLFVPMADSPGREMYTPAYNEEDNLLVRPGLPCMRLTHLSAPVYNTVTDSSLRAASDTAVVLLSALRSGLFNVPG